MKIHYTILALSLSFTATLAQFPVAPSDLKSLKSSADSQVTISFKEARSTLLDVGGYDVNTYFAYFEARSKASSAPLIIYLAGGPGESSLYTALSSESGPCYVNINGNDTITNPWSFNNVANVLYIDQPVQAGFSYDQLQNATFDLNSGNVVTPTDFDQSPLPNTNASFGYGTFPSQNMDRTANSTVQAAKMLTKVVENWLSTFPGYKTKSNKIGIWGNSYGGYWVPETAVQLSKRLDALPSQHPLVSNNLKLDSVGITNGCIDIESGAVGYPDFAYNNTYDVHYASEEQYHTAMDNLNKAGGCSDMIKQCREAGQASDPDFIGSNSTVNEICSQAFLFCELNVIISFPDILQRNPFDVAIPAGPVCDFYLPVHQYLNTASVQQALGVPLNFTQTSNTITTKFGLALPPPADLPLSTYTGDAVRQNGLPNIEYLLSAGVKVALIFGDRDYRCPWTGGEATALATNWPNKAGFSAAGYQELQGVSTPRAQGGLKAVVKQYGTFSFSRVLDAGHAVSAYAPETVYKIFERTLRGVDVVSGSKKVDGKCKRYSTKGPVSSLGWRNTFPANPPTTCMVAGQFQSTNPWDAVRQD